MQIDLIKPYPKNAKKHDKKQIKQVADSISRFGFVQPIVVDKNNEVVIGHCRLEAAKLLNLKEVPTISVEKLSDEEVKALRLADNKLNESAWDMNLAIEDLKGLDNDLLDLTGFDRDLIIDITEDNFDAQAEYDKITKPLSKLGDLWQLGEHRLYCGDSTQKASYEALFASQGGVLADMVFTDPPYNVGYDYDWRSLLHKGKKVKHNFFNDKKSDNDYYQFIKDVFTNAYEITKDNGNFYCWYASKFHTIVEKGLKDGGWLVSQMLIWIKNYPVLSISQDFHRTQEPCLHGWKKGKKHFFNKIGNLRDIINWDELDGYLDIWYEKRDNLADYKHPTQKPIKLAERALKKSSNVGDIILECFNGSGSTMMACEQMKRKCYAIELDPIYVDVAIKRWELFTNGKAKKIN